jgi:ParB family chromosome partitioning protein
MAKSAAHRSAAMRANGEHMIRAYVMKVSEIDARLWEISENLHRAELSALEPAEQIDECRVLTADKVRNDSAPVGGSQSTDLGNRKVAKELGVDEKVVRNSGKIAAISDDAKDAAKAAGLDDNQSALLRVAAASSAELAEIDENLIRAQLSPAQTANAIARRKAIYEERHPETMHGGDRKSDQLANSATRFAASTAEATGKSERSVRRAPCEAFGRCVLCHHEEAAGSRRGGARAWILGTLKLRSAVAIGGDGSDLKAPKRRQSWPDRDLHLENLGLGRLYQSDS